MATRTMEITFRFPSVADSLDVDNLKNNIISGLNVIYLDALERYAVASQISEAAKAAASELAVTAKAFALDNANNCQPNAGDGKEFLHKGYAYRVQWKRDYNFAQNDDNGRFWAQKNALAITRAAEAAAANKAKKGIEPSILQDHPLLQPTSVTSTIMFIGAKGNIDFV